MVAHDISHADEHARGRAVDRVQLIRQAIARCGIDALGDLAVDAAAVFGDPLRDVGLARKCVPVGIEQAREARVGGREIGLDQARGNDGAV